MTGAEIIERCRAMSSAFAGVDIGDVNDAILFIAANSYLPELLIDDVVLFGSSDAATIISATNATPIVIETDAAHPFSTGAYVKVIDIVGNTSANASWFIQKLTATTFSLLGSAGNGDYVSGGTATERDTKKTLSNFHHDIINPVNITTKSDINLRSNKQILYSMYSVSERFYGNIANVAIENDVLYALPVPEADQILSFSCYKKPETISVDDIPTSIPVELHEILIANKILMTKMPPVEKEGKKPVTNQAVENFNAGMSLLLAKFPSPAKQKKRIRRKLCFF